MSYFFIFKQDQSVRLSPRFPRILWVTADSFQEKKKTCWRSLVFVFDSLVKWKKKKNKLILNQIKENVYFLLYPTKNVTWRRAISTMRTTKSLTISAHSRTSSSFIIQWPGNCAQRVSKEPTGHYMSDEGISLWPPWATSTLNEGTPFSFRLLYYSSFLVFL